MQKDSTRRLLIAAQILVVVSVLTPIGVFALTHAALESGMRQQVRVLLNSGALDPVKFEASYGKLAEGGWTRFWQESQDVNFALGAAFLVVIASTVVSIAVSFILWRARRTLSTSTLPR
jgi:hypothetical protein